MTIDDAIVAFEQVASGDYDSLELDVRDYERLVKWLTELKLARESAFSDIGLAARAVSENHQLKAENEKLRELCADTWSYINAPVDHRNCLKERLAIYDDLANRMRELGIEVEE